MNAGALVGDVTMRIQKEDEAETRQQPAPLAIRLGALQVLTDFGDKDGWMVTLSSVCRSTDRRTDDSSQRPTPTLAMWWRTRPGWKGG